MNNTTTTQHGDNDMTAQEIIQEIIQEIKKINEEELYNDIIEEEPWMKGKKWDKKTFQEFMKIGVACEINDMIQSIIKTMEPDETEKM